MLTDEQQKKKKTESTFNSVNSSNSIPDYSKTKQGENTQKRETIRPYITGRRANGAQSSAKK